MVTDPTTFGWIGPAVLLSIMWLLLPEPLRSSVPPLLVMIGAGFGGAGINMLWVAARREFTHCEHGVAGAPTYPARCGTCTQVIEFARNEVQRRDAELVAEKARLVAESERQTALKKKEFVRNVRTLKFLQTLDPEVFQRLVWKIYEGLGFSVEETPMGKDGGVDGILHKNGSRSILQCKRYLGDIGEPIVRDLFGTMHHRRAQSGILVTTGRISMPAHTFAEGKPLSLVDGKRLLELLDAARLSDDVIPDEFVLRSSSPPLALQERRGRSRLCPLCGEKLTRRKGRNGAFLGCTAYPSCKYTSGAPS